MTDSIKWESRGVELRRVMRFCGYTDYEYRTDCALVLQVYKGVSEETWTARVGDGCYGDECSIRGIGSTPQLAMAAADKTARELARRLDPQAYQIVDAAVNMRRREDIKFPKKDQAQ